MPLYRGSRRLILRRNAVVSSLDAATTAWVAAVVTAGGTVSGTQQGFVDTLIKTLKGRTPNLFALHDRIWLHAAENSQQATIDIVNLGVATPVAAPTFTANQGYAGDGSTSYLNSGYSPTVNGVNFTQNSASVSNYIRTSRAITATTATLGSYDAATTGTQTAISPLSSSGLTYDVNNGAFSATVANANAQGFYTAVRTGASVLAVYKNSSSTAVATNAAASSTVGNVNFFIGARNQNGTANLFSSDQIAITTIGGGMTNVQAAQFQTDLNAYMTSLTTNVY